MTAAARRPAPREPAASRPSGAARLRRLGAAGVAVALLLVPASAAGDAPLTDLEALRWVNRVVVIHARGADAAAARTNLEAEAAGVAERDLLWFIIGDGPVVTNFDGSLGASFQERLRERYFTPAANGPRVVLLGKDGGVKSRSGDLDLEELFDRIDRMPMRQREIRERAAEGPQ